MIMLYCGLGCAFGMVFATMCMLLAWISDTKTEDKRLRKECNKAYHAGVAQGKRWKYREMVRAERELEEVRRQVEELKRDN